MHHHWDHLGGIRTAIDEGATIVTHKTTDWPLGIFWAGIALALVAGVFYIVTAWREVRR